MKKTRFSSGTVCLISYLVVLSISSFSVVSAGYGKLFERCTTEKNTFDCLKRRALEVLNTAIKDDSVYVINDFVSVAKDPASSVASKEQQQQSSNDTAVKSLDEQLAKKFQDYLASRSIKLTIPGDAIQGQYTKRIQAVNIEYSFEKKTCEFFVFSVENWKIRLLDSGHAFISSN